MNAWNTNGYNYLLKNNVYIRLTQGVGKALKFCIHMS